MDQNIRVVIPLVWLDYVKNYDKLQVQFFIIEIVFLAEIFLKFFVIKSEDAVKRLAPINSVRITAMSYIQEGFWFDFLIWFPWYFILEKMGFRHSMQLI